MGEAEWRVHRAGAPSLDHLRRQPLLSLDEIEKRLEVSLQTPTILVAYHLVTIARNTLEEVEALFTALGNVRDQILFSYPNADAAAGN
jgi:hypothetical protein